MLEGIKSDVAVVLNKTVGAFNRFINYNRKGASLLDIFPRMGYGEILKPGSVQSMLDSFTGWVYDCVDVRSTKVASTRQRVYKPTEYEEKLIKKHPFYDLMRRPNSYLSEYEFKYLLQAYLDICGSAYIYVNRNNFNRPAVLEFLLPQNTNKIKRDGKTIYTYTGTGEYREFTEDEIIHIKYPNPSNPLQGLSPMVAARMPINLIYYMEQYLLSLMTNRARPDLLFTTEQDISEAEAKRASIAWRKAHGGIDKAGGTAFMGKGLKIQTVSLSPTDVQFLESKKQAFKEISAAYKVPVWKLGETEGVNKSSSHELELSFQRDTISPLLKIRDMYMTNEIISLYDKSLIVKSDNVIPVDIEFERQQEEMDFKHGAIEINEIRKKRGRKPKPYGDGVYMPFNFVKVDGSGIVKPPSIAQGTQPKKIIYNYETGNCEIEYWNHDDRLSEGESLKAMPTNKFKEMKQKHLEMHLKRLGKNEKLMISKLQTFFSKQEKQVLKNLRKLGKDYKDTEVYLPSQQIENEEILLFMIPLVTMYVVEGGETLIEDFGLGIPFDGSSPYVKQFYKNREKLIKDINNTTFNKLKLSLNEGINNGETMKELAGRVETIFGEAKGPRAMKIARTESNTALNYGHHEAMRQANIERHEWIAAHGPDMRDTHEMNEMEGCIPREQAFGGTGEVSPGEPNCQCEEIPCLEDFGK